MEYLLEDIIPSIELAITTRDTLDGFDILPTKGLVLLDEEQKLIVIPIKANSNCYSNIKATKEFVVNILPKDLKDKLEKIEKEFPKGFDEFEQVGFTKESCNSVKVVRIKEALAWLECKWIGAIEIDSIVNLSKVPIFGKVLNFGYNKNISPNNYLIKVLRSYV